MTPATHDVVAASLSYRDIASPMADIATGRHSVAQSLGVREDDALHSQGQLPLRLHEVLLDKGRNSAGDATNVRHFRSGGQDFWWLGPGNRGAYIDDIVNLDGHRITWPTDELRDGVTEALDAIAERPWAMSLVSTYVTTFAHVELKRENSPLITSCSLPDLPLCVLMSRRAFVHIPPSSVSARWSVRIAAENIYHEAVHQAVNHALLTRNVLNSSYSSESSPKIPIYWRSSASETRNRSWELDRVLHAAAVYCHLLYWRYCEIVSPKSSQQYRVFVSKATIEAIGALNALTKALTEHIGHFTASGALMVGRIIESAEMRGSLLKAVFSNKEKRSLPR